MRAVGRFFLLWAVRVLEGFGLSVFWLCRLLRVGDLSAGAPPKAKKKRPTAPWGFYIGRWLDEGIIVLFCWFGVSV